MKKRLVLLLDGTWNSDADSDHLTNIIRLRQMLEAANRAKRDVNDPNPQIEQRLYYDEGVGTGRDRWRGGIFGFGLSENVNQGYRFLSQFYAEGDEIYIFGFSRGAYTARILAGFVAAGGLLRRECCDRANFQKAWDYYRTPTRDRLPADKAALEKLCTPDVRIRFLGVFDTVGALGVPVGGPLRSIGGSRFRFHDTKLGSSIDYAFHALSLDEHRAPFVPSLWVLPDHNKNIAVEQVWFPGVHSDVGGGYPTARAHESSLKASDAALLWMLNRIAFTDLRLVHPHLDDPPPGITELHDSLGWYWASRRKPMYRLVNRARFRQGQTVFRDQGARKADERESSRIGAGALR